jgi:RNAse (barnase) inhibitor barstar
MCDGDFHEFMKEYMEKTCPTNGWDRFEHQLEQYRDLSKALKMCGYYSENLDLKTQEVAQGVKDLKVLANEAKKKFAEKSTKERVEFSFKQWLYGPNPEEGVRKRQGGACDGT